MPHQEQPDSDKCQLPVDLHKTQDLVDSKTQDLVDSKVLPLQLVKVVHRQHRHLIHSSDSRRKLTQVTDLQALGQIMAPLPQLVLDQIMAPAPQLVTQVHSDEASLISQPRRLVVRRDLQQIMLMEAPLKHLRYSVASLPRPHHRLMVRRVEMIPPQVQMRQQVQLMALPQ